MSIPANPAASGPFTTLTTADLPAMRQFLAEVFQLQTMPENLSESALRWKCFEPHPYGPENRGYACFHQGAMVACACLIPIRFLTPQGPLSAGHIVDWAASRRIPGIGVKLYRHLTTQTGRMLGIGGSKDTRSILPRIGARIHQTSYTWIRVARPWLAQRHAPRDWKSPARLGRDILRSWPPIPQPSAWSAKAVERFDDSSVSSVLPNPSLLGGIVCERSAALLNYWLKCPAARMEGYLLQRNGVTAGYFLLSLVRGEGRIADLWVQSDSATDWQNAIATAFHAATAHRDVAWVVTMQSVKPAEEALERMRFQRLQEEVFLLDPGKTIPEGVNIAITMTDYDAFYL